MEFTITEADGTVVDDNGGMTSSMGLYRTDENGQIILDGLVGTFIITETKTIEGYTIHEETRTQTVVINHNDTRPSRCITIPSAAWSWSRSIPPTRPSASQCDL